MADYTLSQLAKSDLIDITEYSAVKFGFPQAEKYTRQLHQSAQLAAEFPLAGHEYHAENGRAYRQFNCGSHALFYVPAESGIFIIRILHLAMDFDRYLN